MSFEAINWAFSQPIKHSTAKFVLVAMANHANAQMTCWPSLVNLCAQTAQDRKTVQAGIVRLRELGYIEDTGERKGTTKQVIVYRLKTPVIGPVSDISGTDEGGATKSSKSTNNGPVSGGNNEPENDTKTVPNKPENGHVKEAQITPSLGNETGPNFPPNRPVFPTKEAQISHLTGPKTGHGTIKEPPVEPSGNHQPRAKQQTLDTFTLPDWIPVKAWDGYLDMRAKKKKQPTELARDLVIAELAKLREAGQNVEAVLNASTRNGWTDVYPVKGESGHVSPQSNEAKRLADNEEAYRLLYGKKSSEVIDVGT